MASWRCLGCRTVYAVGIPACPHCRATDYEEDGVAHVNPDGTATHYVAEGDPVPADLPDGVQLVGPGAPADGPDVTEESPAKPAKPTRPGKADKAAKAGSGPQEITSSGGIRLPKLGASNG